MDIKQVCKSQYLAALAMLREAIELCPELFWDDHTYKNRFWRVAYHALFYVHLYLQDGEESFVPWAKHRPEHNYMGLVPRSPGRVPAIGEPYTREELLAYCTICEQQVEERVASLDLEARSGFSWLPFGKLELQLYSIRHIQQHTGELMERLGTRAGIDVRWVGSRSQAQ